MTIQRIQAQVATGDLARAEGFYTRLFGRAPDARPMDGLIQWQLADTFGLQVWLDRNAAGHATVVLDESDLDARAAQLSAAGIEHEPPQDATGSRILPILDPDGNRLVFTGTFAT